MARRNDRKRKSAISKPRIYFFDFSIDEGDGYRWLHDIRTRRKAKQTRRATKPK